MTLFLCNKSLMNLDVNRGRLFSIAMKPRTYLNTNTGTNTHLLLLHCYIPPSILETSSTLIIFTQKVSFLQRSLTKREVLKSDTNSTSTTLTFLQIFNC